MISVTTWGGMIETAVMASPDEAEDDGLYVGKAVNATEFQGRSIIVGVSIEGYRRTYALLTDVEALQLAEVLTSFAYERPSGECH